MKCANPSCQQQLFYLRGGSLRLLELEIAGNRRQGDAGDFLVSPRTARYFWLCPECSGKLVLRRWTEEGLVLEARNCKGGQGRWIVPPNPAVEAGSILHLRAPAAKTA